MKVERQFGEVYRFIVSARNRAFQAVNTELINLYWKVGEYISYRIANEEWGKSIVERLAKFLQAQEPELKGFSTQNLWRMRQFYEAYRDNSILSPLVRELSWTHNLILLARTKSSEEREFYLRLAIKERYSKRELERQISASVFERSILSEKLSPVMTELQPRLQPYFKDTYIFDFLNLPEKHSEKELQSAIVKNLKQFLLELGNNFAFVGE